MRSTLLVVVMLVGCAAAVAFLAACGASAGCEVNGDCPKTHICNAARGACVEVAPFILAFDQPQLTITKETRFQLVVKLSESVRKKTHVDVTNAHHGFIEVTPTVLLFEPNDVHGDDRKTTTIIGRKSTNGTFREIKFSIRDTEELRFWSVNVRDN